MDLFSITCTTCKSRLKVRDQAAVGQILACPKCGGMVMIKPPPVWNEATEQKSDLPTATELVGDAAPFDQTLDSSAFDVVEELLSDSPPKVQPPPANVTPSPAPPAPAAAKSRFVGGPPAHHSPAPGASAPAKPAALPIPPATHDSDPLPPPPPAETTPPSQPKPAPTSNRRYWIFMAGSVALGILLAFAAVTAAILFLEPVDLASSKTSSVATKSAAPQGNDEAKSSSASSAVAPIDAVPVEPSSAPAASSATLSPAPIASSAASTTDSDPPGLAKAPSAAATAPLPTSDPLAKFDRLIGGAGDDPLANTTDSVARAAPLLPSDPTPARPVAPRPPPREIDVARRLADPLPGIETSGTPLADFVQLMSDLSTIPITLDLPFAPATAESPVVLRLTNSSVEKALAEALRPLRLECVVVEDQLIVRRAETNPIAPFSQNVKDLIGVDEQQMTELAELLKAIVDPAVWGEGERSGSIAVDAAKGLMVITHRRAVQLQVLMALDKLRASRTPPLKPVLKFDPALFALDTRSAQAKPRLEKPVSLNYSQPTRLLTILDRLGQTAGVRILVDWHDVGSAGWNPAAEASFVANNQPLSAALDALLNPLDLTWRIIDGQTLQVVTPARLAEQGELEFFKVDDLTTDSPSGEALLAKVRAALGEASLTGGGNGDIRYEPEGKCLLAWLPQPKQRELEALLARWRSEKAK